MVREDINNFLLSLPKNVTLVAATKYVDAEDMKTLLFYGVNNFGENRVDSFLKKYNELKNNKITWHFIGHLQRNKCKDVINKIDYLHSLDSIELAKMIEKIAEKPVNCFIEISVNHEESKNGVPIEEAENFIKEILKFNKIKIVGLMMMATKRQEDETLNYQFKKLRLLKEEIENNLKIKIQYLSMGMSDDYKEAIEEGATHIRLGRILYNL